MNDDLVLIARLAAERCHSDEGWARLVADVLEHAPDRFNTSEECFGVGAVRYVRWLEGEVERLRGEVERLHRWRVVQTHAPTWNYDSGRHEARCSCGVSFGRVVVEWPTEPDDAVCAAARAAHAAHVAAVRDGSGT